MLLFKIWCAARRVPQACQFVIHTGEEHLEAGCFLYGQEIADMVRCDADVLFTEV